MDRRNLLIGMGLAWTSAGCARVAPAAVGNASPTPTAAPLVVGSDGTVVGEALAALYAGALSAAGVPAATTVLATSDPVPAIESGSAGAVPAFAASLLSGIAPDGEPPAPDEVVTELATLLDPGVAVIRPSQVDGRLVYAVSQETAKAGLTSLADLARAATGATLAGPAWLGSAPDGPAGLTAVYRVTFGAVDIVADPVERQRRVLSGEALVGAFRAPEVGGRAGLSPLADPDLMIVADPQVILVAPSVTGQDAAVLAFDSIQEILTTSDLGALVAEIAGGTPAATAAGSWLKAKGLTG